MSDKPETAFDLPDGEWADLWNAKKVPERKRRPVQRAALAVQRLMPSKAVVHTKDAPEGAVPDSAFGAPPIDELIAAAEPEPDIKPSDITDEAWMAMDKFNDALILGLTKAWSYGEVTDGVLGDLPADAYDALVVECRRLNKGEDGASDSLDEDPSSP